MARLQDSGLDEEGILNPARVHRNLSVPALYEEAIRRREGLLAAHGPLVCSTGPHTGRSPNDKFIVREPSSAERVWWGAVNRPIAPEHFDALHQSLLAYLDGKEIFVLDAAAGADPEYRVPIRIITEHAWHSLFAKHMFITAADGSARSNDGSRFTVIAVPSFKANPAVHGTRSEVFILVNFARRLILIGGTSYAGEIKKSIFTVANYLLPLRKVMPMHCSANVGPADDVALFFGLSGTGKTTLSSDPERRLIGDDEHGWSDRGVFNIEGGCYAKLIRLSAPAEPQIFSTTRRFGTVLENVTIERDSRLLNLDDDSITENTRGAYPLSFIDNAIPEAVAGHPRNIVMLTADAFGVMPPIARLTPAAAMYHFLSGYTAKVAGTERGVTEPKATFSTCFAAPFLVLHPYVYARFLGEKIARHHVRVWLVNTGWTGGPYGIGSRMKIADTRAMIHAALSGALEDAEYETDPVFRVAVPTRCPGVSTDILRPRQTWRDPSAYDAQARKVAQMFVDNFKVYGDAVEREVSAAGPRA
jgi:phosphoenolpyruvate carboxykinase (ATP)